MSDNVEFILSLDDKKFTAAIDRAGKLLVSFGEKATKPAQKIATLERSLGSVAGILGTLDKKLESVANGLQDLGAGFELVSKAMRDTRQELVTFNANLKTYTTRIDAADKATKGFHHSLQAVQSELSDFSDWANHAGRAASSFGHEVKEANTATSGMNTRLSNSSKRMENWAASSTKAAAQMKKVVAEMDALINRQRELGNLRADVRGPGRGGSGGGSGGSGGGSGRGGRHSSGGLMDGMKGNIFMLGEIGDAAYTVQQMLFGWQVPIVEAAAQMQKMRILLEGMNKEAANPKLAATNDMNYIVNMAKTAPFAMEALTDAFVKFKSAGIDPANGSLKSLVDSVARFGGDSELLKRAAVAIQQMSGKGVISMEELRQQLGEAVPTAMQAMADSAGVTMGQLTKAISTGTVSAKQGLELLFQGLDAQSRGAAENLMQAYSGALAQLQTSFTLFADRIGKAGYLDSITNAFKELSTYMNSTDGKVFAQDLGEGLSKAVDGLMDMAKWAERNKELLLTLGQVALGMVGFKVLKGTITGVATAGAEMGGGLKKAFEVVNGAGAKTIGAIGKVITSIRTFGTTATLIIGVGEAIKMVRTAWLAFSAVVVANPVGAAITAIAIAVGGLIAVMSSLRDKTAETVAEIRKIPEAMTAAQRSQMTARASELDRKNALDQQTLDLVSSGKMSGAGVDTKLIQDRLARNKAESTMLKETIGMGDKAQYENLARDIVTKRLEDVDNGIKAGMAKYSTTTLKDARNKRTVLSQDQKMSPSEKSAQLEAINNADRDAHLKPFLEGADKTQKIVDSLGQEVVRISKLLENPTLNESDRSRLQGQLNGQSQAFSTAQDSLKGLQEQIKNIREQSGKGLQMLDGSYYTGVGGTKKQDDRLNSLFVNSQLGTGKQTRMNPDGTIMRDIAGDAVMGDAQLKANTKLRSIYGETIKMEQLTADQREKISSILTAAKLKDEQKAQRAAERAGKSAESAAKREESARQKAIKANETWIGKAEQMAGQLGLSSKASVEFDQNIQEVTKHLTEMANAVPSDTLSKGMIDNAKTMLAFINQNKDAYSKRLNQDAAEQSITKFAPMANKVVNSGYTPDYQSAAAEWNKKFNESLAYLQSQSKNAQDQGMKEVYDRAISQMLAGRNKAFIAEVGTSQQKLAQEYSDVASQMESVWTSCFENLTDKLTEFVKTGKFSIADFGDYIFDEMLKVSTKALVVEPLMQSLGMGTNSGASWGDKLSGAKDAVMGSFTKTQQSGSPVEAMSSPASAGNDSGSMFDGLKNSFKSLTTSVSDLASSGLKSLKDGFNELTGSTKNSTTAVTQNAASTQEATSATRGFTLSASTAVTAIGATISALGAATGNKWMGYVGAAASIMGLASSAYGAMSSAGWTGNSASTVQDGTKGFQVKPNANQFQVTAHAKGGVFGPDGVVPLKKYAKGGIASSPQLALFGEGSHKEAYVPLPDGRSIPVTFTGGGEGAGGDSVAISITVQNYGDGSSKSSENSDNGSQWNDMARKVKAVVLDTLTDESRPGGMLSSTSK
ncbi:tape measure protein [Kluyvera ascorbata]|uniref:Tape measure protein n=1 Tax=Kluyvera ascorbata TaxID=51288 RepID=A0AB35XFS0_9ENTR